MFVDTHTHFYDEWLLPEADAAVQRALEAGVDRMIQADVDSRERPAMWEVARRHPDCIFQMLGLYPGSVTADNWQDELDQVYRIASEGYPSPHTLDLVQNDPSTHDLDQVRDNSGLGPIPEGGPGPATVLQKKVEAIHAGPGPGHIIGPSPNQCWTRSNETPQAGSGNNPQQEWREKAPAGVRRRACLCDWAVDDGQRHTSPGAAGEPPVLKEPRIVAIGEIGLDYHEGLAYAKEQKEVLRLQLELAAQMDLPVNIHLRDAWEDLLAILEDCRHLHLRGNLHCFTSSYEIYERANRSGHHFAVGIGGVVTFRNASIAKTLERIPLEDILLETDAPYLAPVPHRGQRNESAYLPLVAQKIADIKGLSLNEIAEITTHNAETLFNL